MEYRIINRNKIELGKDLLKLKHEDLMRAKSVFADTLLQVCYSMPPIVFAEANNYILVARHLSFVVFIEQIAAVKIPVIIVGSKERKALAMADKIIMAMIGARAESLTRKKSKAGVSRSERKRCGYICPLCGLLIKATRGSMPVTEGQNEGYYLISCRGSIKEVPCGFRAYLSKEEYILFRSRDYPVSKWLEKTEGKCPECGKPLFLRSRFSNKMLMCADNFRLKGSCKYRQAFKEG